MKKNLLYISVLIGTLTGCSDNSSVQEDSNMPENNVSVEVSDFVFEAGTRSAYIKDGDRYVFSWDENDDLGVFATKGGHQAIFHVKSGVGSSTALLENGDWTLRPNTEYVAYYPFSVHSSNQNKITVDYNCDWFPDFMYSKKQTTDGNGNVNFEMQHLCSLIEFNFVAPKGYYNGEWFEIKSNNVEFIEKGHVDLADNEPYIHPDKTSVSVSQTFDVEFAELRRFTNSFMLLPRDMSNSELSVFVHGFDEDNNNFTFEFEPFKGKDFKPGKAYSFDLDAFQFVDLGLPSGTLWATRNIGTTSYRPSDYGYYLQWGELKPEAKITDYTYANYDYYEYKDGKYLLTKYSPWDGYGVNDTKKQLALSDDVAYQLWGEEYTIPNGDDFTELKNNCTFTYEKINDVECAKVTGPNGNFIYLPAAGHISGDDKDISTSLEQKGEYGYYLARDLFTSNNNTNPNKNFALWFQIKKDNSIAKGVSSSYRNYGLSVRPVKYKEGHARTESK